MSASRRSVSGPGKRALVALAMGAIISPFTLTGIAHADVRPITEFACPEDQVTGPEVPFDDIEGLDDEARTAINCIADYGVTQGVDEDSFEPGNRVNRAQMALFLARLVSLSTDEPLEDESAGFTDLQGLSEDAVDSINIIANLGITTGKTETTYAPSDPVTRAQMASFLVRTQGVIGVPFDEALDDYFEDDNGLEPHEDNINILFENGLAQGVEEGRFAPERATTREQMARFLARLLDLAVEEGNIESPYDVIVDEPTVTITTAQVMAGGEVEGTFVNVDGEVVSVALQGEGLADVEVTLNEDGSFVFTLPEGIEAGDLPVTFVLTLGDDTTVEIEAVLEVTAPTVQPNETLTFGPDEAVSLELTEDADDTADRRGFLATGLDDDLEYRVTLVEADLVTVGEDGVVRFTNDEDTGEEGFAEVGDADTIAEIVDISNAGSDPAGGNSATARPVNGAITVTIEGETAGSVVPVIYVNGGPGGTPEQGGTNIRLELDEDGLPSEPFGIAGVTTFTNPEAGTGLFGGFGDNADAAVEVDAVDEDGDVIDAGGALYRYGDEGDTYFIDADGDFTGDVDERVTVEEFEAELSVGDSVSGSYSQEFESVFVLTDVTPTGVTLSIEDENDTNVVLTVAGLTEGNTVTVYGVLDEGAVGDVADDVDVTTESPVLATTAEDQDEEVDGFQVVVGGLTAETNYDLAATQTEDEEQSELGAEVEVTTTATQVSPVISGAVLTTDAPIEGLVGDADVLTFTFNRGVTVAAAGDTTMTFRDADGDTFVVSGATEAADDFLTAATIDASDEDADADGTEETVTVTLTENAEDRNAAGDGEIQFPVTLTAATGITDTATEGEATLTGSDVTLGDES